MPLKLTSRLMLWLIDRTTRGGGMPEDLGLLRRTMNRPAMPLWLPRRQLRSVEERRIPGPGGELTARIYRPEEEPAGIILFLHGGGFVHCGLDSHDAIACGLAAHAGCTLVSLDYRLAPEHPFPAAVEDCHAALLWTAANAEALGADAGRIAVAGDSAGGNLAAVLTQLARDRGGPQPAFQLLYYPATHGLRDVPSRHRYGRGYFLTTAIMQWYLARYIDSPEHHESPRFAPILGHMHGLPPACIITAEFDPLRDEGAHYAAALEDAGVPVDYLCVRGVIHAFLMFQAFQPAARLALRRGARAIRAAMLDQSRTAPPKPP